MPTVRWHIHKHLANFVAHPQGGYASNSKTCNKLWSIVDGSDSTSRRSKQSTFPAQRHNINGGQKRLKAQSPYGKFLIKYPTSPMQVAEQASMTYRRPWSAYCLRRVRCASTAWFQSLKLIKQLLPPSSLSDIPPRYTYIASMASSNESACTMGQMLGWLQSSSE